MKKTNIVEKYTNKVCDYGWVEDDNFVGTILPKKSIDGQSLMCGQYVRNKFVSALEQAKRAPAGGAYIAMKGMLGDAISGPDYAGITGFGIDTGIISKIKESLGAAGMTDADANAILQQAVSGFNAMLNSYNSRFNDDRNPEFVNKAKKAFAIQPLSYGVRQSSGSGESRLDKIRRLRAEREKMGAK